MYECSLWSIVHTLFGLVLIAVMSQLCTTIPVRASTRAASAPSVRSNSSISLCICCRSASRSSCACKGQMHTELDMWTAAELFINREIFDRIVHTSLPAFPLSSDSSAAREEKEHVSVCVIQDVLVCHLSLMVFDSPLSLSEDKRSAMLLPFPSVLSKAKISCCNLFLWANRSSENAILFFYLHMQISQSS